MDLCCSVNRTRWAYQFVLAPASEFLYISRLRYRTITAAEKTTTTTTTRMVCMILTRNWERTDYGALCHETQTTLNLQRRYVNDRKDRNGFVYEASGSRSLSYYISVCIFATERSTVQTDSSSKFYSLQLLPKSYCRMKTNEQHMHNKNQINTNKWSGDFHRTQI